MDQSKKTMRHFYCRDVLWETFEQMANDFDCSIDYLINEAMRYYARSKNYQAAHATGGDFRGSTGPGGPSTNPPPQPVAPPVVPTGGGPATIPPNAVRRTGPPPPPPRPMGTATNPPVAAQGYPQQQPLSVTPSQGMPSLGQQPRRPSPPSPRTPPVGADPMQGQTTPTLFLIFNSQKIPIEKDQFIIGRGSKTSDLAIKDGNISRKHAAVIRRNGTYYIKDLGSTNGIDYKGMRIDNKRIDEGDVFHLCDYELRFTYRA